MLNHRSIRSHLRLAIATGLALAGLGLIQTVALAAPTNATAGVTYVVTRADDPTPGGCLAGDCSLREAVIASNNNPGADTIQLTRGSSYTLTIAPAGANDASSGDLNLTDSVTMGYSSQFCFLSQCAATIRGAVGTWNDRIFTISNGAQAQMTTLTIRGGNTIDNGGGIVIRAGSGLTLTSVTVTANHGGSGGGIYVAANGTLALRNSYLTANTAATNGGGLYTEGGLVLDHTTINYNTAQELGGGLLIYLPTAPITITYLTASQNTSNNIMVDFITVGGGGGIYIYIANSILLDHITAVNNTALALGGGLFIRQGAVTLQQSTITNNTAPSSAGISVYSSNSSLLVLDTAILTNTATNGDGGGLGADGFGGFGSINVRNSTISGNTATNSGGGMSIAIGGVFNTTITNNTADSDNNGVGDGGGFTQVGAAQNTIELANSIVAGNHDAGGQAPECSSYSVLSSLGYNLIQTTANCPLTATLTGNLLNVNPNLGPVGDYGGPTWTQSVLPGSPAIEGGNPAAVGSSASACLATDQRGQRRPIGIRCDMGAYEAFWGVPSRLSLPMISR